MKKILLSIVAIAMISLSALAQSPEGFKYQAVVRDGGNLILVNQAVGMQLTLQQGSIGGTAVYTETFCNNHQCLWTGEPRNRNRNNFR